ncbi:hypothetical protein AAG570_000030 [Ranatra chinensis]|uniref:Reverse transcriptase RNase H-like domain-containing protein n=1 Tax=Ranatra chinensis TaxID=642074 RepID=A0ABD0ZCU2_9HEMI
MAQRPIAFDSRRLNQTEVHYSATERELLAVIWATQQFRCYLLGRKFTRVTDYGALRWMLSLRDPSSRLTRAVVLLERSALSRELSKFIKDQYVSTLNVHDGSSLARDPSGSQFFLVLDYRPQKSGANGHCDQPVANALPADLNLISGTDAEEAYLYYQVAGVHALALLKALRLVVDVPLKAVGQSFILYSVKRIPFESPELKHTVVLRFSPYYFLCVLLLRKSADREALLLGTFLRVYAGPSAYGTRAVNSVPATTILRSKCRGKEHSEIGNRGTGTIKAVDGCSLRTSNYWFLHSTSGNTYVTMEKRIKVATPVKLWREPPASIQKTDSLSEALIEQGQSVSDEWASETVRLETLVMTLDRMEDRKRNLTTVEIHCGASFFLRLLQ